MLEFVLIILISHTIQFGHQTTVNKEFWALERTKKLRESLGLPSELQIQYELHEETAFKSAAYTL